MAIRPEDWRATVWFNPWAYQSSEQIRARRPSLTTLPEHTRAVADELATTGQVNVFNQPGTAEALAARAADRIFSELIGDDTALNAIATALPGIQSTNPREIKRYVNLFRFYAFVVFRRRLDGSPARTMHRPPRSPRSPYQLSKLAREDGAGVTALQRMEDAACNQDDDAWRKAGGEAVPRSLRTVLAAGPPIAEICRGLI